MRNLKKIPREAGKMAKAFLSVSDKLDTLFMATQKQLLSMSCDESYFCLHAWINTNPPNVKNLEHCVRLQLAKNRHVNF